MIGIDDRVDVGLLALHSCRRVALGDEERVIEVTVRTVGLGAESPDAGSIQAPESARMHDADRLGYWVNVSGNLENKKTHTDRPEEEVQAEP